MNPTDGKINTEDILYTMESKFKKDLKKATEAVKIENLEGNEKEVIKDLGNKKKKEHKDGEKPTDPKPKKKLRRGTKVDNGDGDGKDDVRKEHRYNVSAEAVERVVIRNREFIKFDLVSSEAESKKICDIALVVVDGMGEECPNEFNILDNYESVIDKNTSRSCLIKDNLIKNATIKKGKVNIEVKLNNAANKALKFVYYVEV